MTEIIKACDEIIKAQDILSSMFANNEEISFRILDDKKSGNFKGLNLSFNLSEYSLKEKILKDHNAQNHGIFFVVNFGGHDDKSINRINAQFVEIDNGSFEEQQKRIDNFPLKPSIIIKTQKSLHVYWLVDKKAKVKRFRTIQKQLAEHFDSDRACVNESRLMRLPGFNHCKTDTLIPVTCISFHPERRYTQDQIVKALPKSIQNPIEKRSGNKKGLEIVTELCEFIQYCKDNAAVLSEPYWFAMITILSQFEGGAEIIHELSSPYPIYTPEETQNKINYVLDKNYRALSCQKLMDGEFTCSKFKDGVCKAKSAASLCYEPVSAQVLKDEFEKITCSNDIDEDMKAIEEFITKYLVNQTETKAKSFINNTIANKFRLNSDEKKDLLQLYRKAHKTCAKEKEDIEATADLPLWHERKNGKVLFYPFVLAKHMAKNKHVIWVGGQYYEYIQGRYKEIDIKKVKAMVQSEMLDKVAKMTNINDTTEQWTLLITKDANELNNQPFIINLKNGIYDLKNDKLFEHSPDFYSTIQLNAAYDSNASCPIFLNFLNQAMQSDEEQIALIQEMLGYCLIPVNNAQKSFILYGAPAAGKSVLLKVLSEILLGSENVSNISWQALSEQFKPAELYGKLANIFADLPTKNIQDTGIFKAIVGEDIITVERKYQQPFSFKSFARLIFSCNLIPLNYGDKSEGFFRRLIIIPFNQTIPEEQRDPNLINKLKDETNGIFLFALQGLKRLIANNYKFTISQANIDELNKYRTESSSVLSFIEDCCEIDNNASTNSEGLYISYKNYCTLNGFRDCSHNKLISELKSAYPTITNKRNTNGTLRIIKGIKLK